MRNWYVSYSQAITNLATKGGASIDSKEKAIVIAKACEDKKADDIVLMDMRKSSNITDYFIICSGSSSRKVKGIADGVRESLEGIGVKVWHIEGYRPALWILLDCGDAVAHIFYSETRRFYDLERLWGDAPLTRI